MTLRCAALLAVLCLVRVAHAQQAPLPLRAVQPGETFTIQTEDRFYRGQVVNRDTGETLMSASWDGRRFSSPQKVYLLGSTSGRSAESGKLMLVRMHEVKPGMCLELGMGSLDEHARRLTSHVVAYRVE